jgi:hypothetical protein
LVNQNLVGSESHYRTEPFFLDGKSLKAERAIGGVPIL